MSVIARIHTPCKTCVFAKYQNNTQIGCEAKYLEKYREKNTEILEVYDNDKEFYIINNKKCIGYREAGWFTRFGMQNSTIQEKIDKVIESNKVSYCVMLDLKLISNIQEVEKILHELNNSQNRPQKIIIIKHNFQHKTEDFSYNSLRNVLSKLNNIEWRIQNMLHEKRDQEIIYEISNINKKYRVLFYIKNYSDKIKDIISLANKKIYEDLSYFIAIKDAENSSIMFAAAPYRYSLVKENKNILLDDTNYIII